MITVKLFRFSLPDVEGVLYLYSLRSDVPYLRKQFEDQDSGPWRTDMSFEVYRRLYTDGRVERITSLDQVPRGKPDAPPYDAGGDQWCLPYHSWELENNSFELTIEEFFHPPEQYL